MPNNFAKVRITQFLPGDGTKSISNTDMSAEGSFLSTDSAGTKTGDLAYSHLDVIQNPRPVQGNDGYNTIDPDTWTDSPLLNPTLPSYRRFAYGRGDTRYKKLDKYSGLVLRQTNYDVDGDYICNSVQHDGDFYLKNLSESVDGSVLIQDHEQVTGEVTVSSYDFVVQASPEPFSYKNPVDSDVSIRLSNYVYPLNSGTVTLTLDGEEKSGLSVVPFYTGLGGFDATWTNTQEFSYNEQVDVVWSFYDTDSPPNQITVEYWFRTVQDYIGPRIISTSPVDDATGISVDSCITFSVRDYELGVDIDSLELYVNNVLIQSSDLTIFELSTQDGYSVSYCPTNSFLYGDEIPVSIYIEDLSEENNYTFYVFSFTTESSNTPVIVSRDPAACKIDYTNKKYVEVDVVDGGHGLDTDSVVLSVDDDIVQPRRVPIIYREE